MNSEIEIRQAGKADAAAIRSLTRDAYAKWVPRIGREPLPMAADYDQALKRHRFDLLTVKGDLAALIETVSQGSHLLIENVAVSPPHQGEGLGRTLMDHAERIATSQGLPEIKLYTNKLFAGNLTFYDRLGYRIEREEQIVGGVCVHMTKSLRQF